MSLYTLPKVPLPIAEKTVSAPAKPIALAVKSNSLAPGFSSLNLSSSGPKNIGVEPAANLGILVLAPPAIIPMLTGALSAKPLPNCLKPSDQLPFLKFS